VDQVVEVEEEDMAPMIHLETAIITIHTIHMTNPRSTTIMTRNEIEMVNHGQNTC